jgi:hypothetical protein
MEYDNINKPSVLDVFINYCIRTYSKQASDIKIYNIQKLYVMYTGIINEITKTFETEN